MEILELPITGRKKVAEGTFEIHLSLNSHKFIFRPGQYIRVIIPELIEQDPKGNYRDFSIASSPNNEKELIISVRVSESGFKKSLIGLPDGTTVKVSGPFGSFLELDNSQKSPIVFIAGGIGITPFFSAIKFFKDVGFDRPVILLYGNRDAGSSAYISELQEIQDKFPDFKFKNKLGLIDSALIKDNTGNLKDPVFFIAGSPAMVSSVISILSELGVPDKKIHTEEFLGYEAGSSTASIAKATNSLTHGSIGFESKIEMESLLEALDKTARVSKTNADGTIIFANDKFVETTKYSREELIGQNHRILKSGHHNTDFYNNLWDTISAGKIWRGEIRDKAKDGTFFWVDTSIAPILGNDGRPVSYISVGFPITKRKELEEALVKENQVYFKEITNTITEVFFVTSGDLQQMLYISPGYEKIWGRTAQSLYDNPRSWVEAIHPDDRAGVVKNNFEDNHMEPYSQSYRIITLAGEIRWMYVKSFPVMENGKKVKLVGVVEDITEQKIIQEQIKDSEVKFRQIADNIQEVFFLIDPIKPETLYVSLAYENIFGEKREKLYTNPLAWLDSVVPEDRLKMASSFKNLVSQVSSQPSEEYFKIKNSNSEIRNLRVKLFGIKGEDGKVYRVVGIVEDVTELTETQTIAIKLEEELKLKKAQDEFISIASHQLKTPVAGLSWTMDSLRIADDKLDDKQKSYIKNMRGFINMLDRTVEDLLNVSRIDLGTLRIDSNPVDIIQFINKFVEEMRPYAESQKHTLTFDNKAPASLNVAIDSKMLYTVLQNIVSNGIEYSPDDPSVKISVASEPGFIKVSVFNNGHVILDENKVHIFEKFYRTDFARTIKPNGTGIGLFISKSFIEKSGGTIGFESEAGKGTTFWFKLPLIKNAS